MVKEQINCTSIASGEDVELLPILVDMKHGAKGHSWKLEQRRNMVTDTLNMVTDTLH